MQYGRERRDVSTDSGFSTTYSQSLVANFSSTWRRTDNLLSPTRGYLLNLQVGGAPVKLFSSTRFARLYGKATGYFPLGESNTLILRGEAGAIAADTRNGIPTDFLFRAGGDQSLRGYGYQQLGVRRRLGDCWRGRYLAVGSAEADSLAVAKLSKLGHRRVCRCRQCRRQTFRPEASLWVRRRRAMEKPGRRDQSRRCLWPEGARSAHALFTGSQFLMAVRGRIWKVLLAIAGGAILWLLMLAFAWLLGRERTLQYAIDRFVAQTNVEITVLGTRGGLYEGIAFERLQMRGKNQLITLEQGVIRWEPGALLTRVAVYHAGECKKNLGRNHRQLGRADGRTEVSGAAGQPGRA